MSTASFDWLEKSKTSVDWPRRRKDEFWLVEAGGAPVVGQTASSVHSGVRSTLLVFFSAWRRLRHKSRREHASSTDLSLISCAVVICDFACADTGLCCAKVGGRVLGCFG